MATDEFELVQVPSGAWSIRPFLEAETYHPGVGPAVEAAAIYVGPLQLRTRHAALGGKRHLVVWDVGLGAGANAISVLTGLAGGGGSVTLCSFDRTLSPLAFARTHAARLGYLAGFEPEIDALLARQRVDFTHQGVDVRWEVHLGDFPSLLGGASPPGWPSPDAILYDPHSPRRNPDMWTLPLFRRIRARLAEDRPCNLATYSRSTLLRVTLLQAGFYVGVGPGHEGKEETTVAANVPMLAGRLLDRTWLARVERSTSAEPLDSATYRQSPLSAATREGLASHPQFRDTSPTELYGSDKTFAPSGTDMA